MLSRFFPFLKYVSGLKLGSSGEGLRDTGALTECFRLRVNRDVQYEKNNVFLEH